MSKPLNTIQIDTLYLQREADFVRLQRARSSSHDPPSLQVDVKSSITYCTLDEFTALIASSGHSVCKQSGVTAHRFALVCCKFLICEGHVRLDSSRRAEEPPVLFSSSNQLYGSVKAARSTLTPRPVTLRPPPPPPPPPPPAPGAPPSQPKNAGHHSVVGMLLTWLSWLDPDAFSELRFSSLLMISAHVFLYWCRSREYTKGSQAALL